MNKTKTVLYLVFLVLFAAAIFIFVKFAGNAALIGAKVSERDAVSEAVSDLSGYDYRVYWIGDMPCDLSAAGDRIISVSEGDISEDTMPVKWVEIAFREYDESGNLVRELLPRDYAEHLFIVVNNCDALSDEQLDTINSCFLENNVSVIFIGQSTVEMYREFVFDSREDDCCSLMMSKVYGNSRDFSETACEYTESGDNGEVFAAELLGCIYDMMADTDT